MGAVDEGFAQVDLAALPKILDQRGQDSIEDALPLPLLKAIVARLIRRVAAWKIRPGRARTQYPKDPVEHVSRIPPRAPSACRRSVPLWLGDTAPNCLPLLVGEIHRRRYKHLPAQMESPF